MVFTFLFCTAVFEFICLIGNIFCFIDWAAWSNFALVRWCMGIKFKRIGENTVHISDDPKKKTIWLVNHRTFADFSIDHILTGYQAAYLSRWMVIVAIPFSGLSALCGDWVWFFTRPSVRIKKGQVAAPTVTTTTASGVIPPNLQIFYDFMDKKFKETPWNGLIIYPEGTRNLTSESISLKTGSLRYIYDRQIDVQIIISYGKEMSYSEKQWTASLGKTIYTSYSKLINPRDFKSLEEFTAEIQREWDNQWDIVYSRKYPEYPQSGKREKKAKEEEEQENKNENEKANEKEKELPITDYEPPYVPKPLARASKFQPRFYAFVAVLYSLIFYLIYCAFF